ncbi:pentapeptide repeat-containing protein [Cellvibrio sp. OA-2007]|uniref:pentapeptide repeat-containing protein n=1 Tax=Cellvibrio sp. OA-2007 TaxID=529823 RepID=UPI0035CFDA94
MIQLGSTACADSQRVPPSPSTALAAAVNAVLAVTVRPWDTNTGGQLLQAATLELLGAALDGAILEGAVLDGAVLDGATLLGAVELLLLLARLDGAATELLDDELPAVAGASLL